MPAVPPVRWVVDTYLTDIRRYQTGFPTIEEAASELGFEVYKTQYIPGKPDTNVPFKQGECVVTYGTHQFLNQIKRQYKGFWQPGSYHRIENLSYSAYSPYIGDLLLNDDFVLLPFGEVVRRGCRKPFFLKPDAVTKAFTGLVVTPNNFEHEISTLRQVHHVTDDVICVLAEPKEIEGEFRFVIADGEVIAGSEYRWDNTLDIRTDVHPVCEGIAREIAKREWQPDTVYTCDVALTNGRTQGRVVELNTFSCSGLYACDTRRIVEAVSQAAWREYNGFDQ